MKFENTFVVQAPIEDVWLALMDLERVAPCMPGAEVLERTGDDQFNVAIRVKLGPMSLQYRGHVAIVERDDAAWTAVMRARARESRGQGTADARMDMALADDEGATRGTITTELQITGRAAAMGRGMVVDVAQKLTELFAVNLAEMLAPKTKVAEGANAPAPSASPGPAQTAQTAGEESLPVAQIAASVISDRLGTPRAIVLAAGALAAVFAGIGYMIGKRR